MAAAPAVLASLSLLLSTSALAEDKNGVSPKTISLPSGPGSLEGLGDSFQPALNTGTARYQLALLLPKGVAGFSPEVSLRYDSGNGFGPVGMGWSVGPGDVRRQTEKGLPRYVDPPGGGLPPDRFLGIESEELVPLANGRFLAKVENKYIRYQRVAEHWEARTKSGIKLQFGLTADARVSDETGTKIYRWALERQTDTRGNVIEYRYIRPSNEDRQIYLSEIRYGPGEGPWGHYYSVEFVYEDRPDPFTDYRSGFRVRTTKRLSKIDIKYDQTLIRRYVLGYQAHPHWSLLTTVAQFGEDADDPTAVSLPVTTFGYPTFGSSNPCPPISALGQVIGSTGEPASVMDTAETELLDINADGLPDLLSTDLIHLAYINRGVQETAPGQRQICWDGPLEMSAADPRVLDFQLSAENVHLADMTGEGIADLVVTDPYSVEYFTNTGQIGWESGQLMSVQSTPPPAPFGPGGEHVRTADLDFDKRIDIIKSELGTYLVWFNLGEHQYSEPVYTNGCWQGGQFIDLADTGVDLADLNGDRLPDVHRIAEVGVTYWPGMGYGQFDDPIQMMLPPGSSALTIAHIERAKMMDVNGDGLTDLLVERFDGPNLRFWLNLGNNTFAPSCEIIDLPATPNAVTRWADVNGNGTTDLIYADSTLPESKINAVDIGELVAGPTHVNLLTSIDNGYGRRVEIQYRSTTEYYVDAHEVGNPWTLATPFPTPLVAATATSIGLDLDGYPDEGSNGDVYLTDFVYRDGFYDPLENQFRGFAFVKQIEHGDERFGGAGAPTLVTRFFFHTGGPDGIDNDGDGDIDEYDRWAGREEEPLKGVELWRETTALPDDPLADGSFANDSQVFERHIAAWEVRDLCTADGGAIPSLLGPDYQASDYYGRAVRQAVRTSVHKSVIERTNGDAKQLETRSDLDPFGNTLFEWNKGDVNSPTDDLYTGYEYVPSEPTWMMDRVSRVFQADGGSYNPISLMAG